MIAPDLDALRGALHKLKLKLRLSSGEIDEATHARLRAVLLEG